METILIEFKELQAINNHTEAVQLLVNTFGTTYEKEVMKAIGERHKKFSYILVEDIKTRSAFSTKYYPRLLNAVKSQNQIKTLL